MRSAVLSAIVALAAAAPLEQRAAAINDAQILNYALTLEHLEDTFYSQALQKFSEEDFRKAGVHGLFYENLKEISYDEKTHVSFLTGALQNAGYTPVAACTYNFGDDTVESFLKTAALLEGVGVSAYLGAAQNITNKAYLTAAGSILTVEARHSSYLRANQVPPQSPFPYPFDIPLDFDEVYSLAALFITSCPSTNPALPVKAFPAVTDNSASPSKVGDKISITAATSVDAKTAYFVTILGPVAAPITGSGVDYTVTIPTGVQNGQEYLILTNDATAAPSDDNIVAIGVVAIQDNIQAVEANGTEHQSWKHSGEHQW